MITFGVLMIGYALRRGSMALYAERRPFLARVRPGSVGAVPLGMAFAAGWTPCIGPVLGSILAIAASGSTARAVLLLVSYSAGLGVPFLLVGLGVTRFMGHLRLGEAPVHADRDRLGVAHGRGRRAAVHRGVHRMVAPLAERFTAGHLMARG